ncbi:N-acetylmuramoyl-L-alanine amidase [Candidatus Peregrinibacteria bacterium]|nr:N-acetylmuramoyl-L-alanine amidase [Candidatus Peregrinibacteria bacterium]
MKIKSRTTKRNLIATVGVLALFIALSINYTGPKTKVLTIKNNIDITIDSHKLVDSSLITAPYKTMDVFISNEESSGFKFSSVGGSWEEIAPPGTKVEVLVRFKNNNQWSDWIKTEEEEDLNQNGKVYGRSIKKYGMASTDSADAMRYKFELYGDGMAKPIVKNPAWTFIKAEENFNYIKNPTPAPQYSAYNPISTSTYLALTPNSKNIISRSEWGADESYRYLSDNTVDPVLIEINPDYYEKYKTELEYAKVVDKDQQGNKYKWPLQYPKKVKKFIIHHTATTGNLDNPKQAIRDIYYYHAITRAWGDIGYNYLVDLDGRVYEGRYGGESVIGAHSGPGNNGSIGIAILGNYEENDISDKIIANVSSFISQKSKLHGINPNASSLFRGQIIPNIFGHKDIMSTDCPGAYLYAKLPIIRYLADKYMTSEKQKFVNDYDYEDTSGIYYLEPKPKEVIDVTLKLENIGKVDWNKKTFIVVDKDPAFENVLTFPTKKKDVLAKMNESVVKPGDTGTFTFQIKAGKKSQLVYLNIAPVINGAKKAKDYVVIPVSVEQVDYRYAFVDAKYPEKTMQQGEEFTGFVKLKNTGNITWRKTGEDTITLATDHSQDRVSKFISSNPTRMGYLQEDEVKPGEIGTFSLNLKAPNKSGYYKEYFTPMVEGVSWMADSGMYFETTVMGGQYEAEWVSTSAGEKMERGGKYLIKIKLRNIGKEKWDKDNLQLMFLKNKNTKISDVLLLNEKVATGDAGTLTFVVEIDKNEALQNRTIIVRPRVNGHYLLKKPIYIRYKVIESTKLSAEQIRQIVETNIKASTDVGTTQTVADDTSSPIRVKISFSGNPKITANGGFDIYSGNESISSLNAGETAEVKMADNKYQVKIKDDVYLKDNPIRFVPKSGYVLKIDNFDHRPDWNKSLNDNEYRGILEVNNVDNVVTVINEIPLEAYLKGLGEAANSDPMEKIKAVVVAARTYAKYYTDIGKKFQGKPYNLDDDPNVSQRYIGYGMEKRNTNVVSAVDKTRGEVVYYNGVLVKTPYFSQSDGTYTKSAKDVWGLSADYLVPVSDSYCKGTKFSGHGVGLSGCGAKGMADAGFTYVDILKHYYTGIEVKDLY